jgi:hypothetical protein
VDIAIGRELGYANGLVPLDGIPPVDPESAYWPWI